MNNRSPLYDIQSAEGQHLGWMSSTTEERLQALADKTWSEQEVKLVKVCWACKQPFEHGYFTCCAECRGVKDI